MPGPETTVDWDAGSYDRVGDPQLEWAQDVLARIELAGDERVLDAGCGTGRVTRLLLDRLPRGRLVGVDASPSMIEKAKQAIGDDPRVELIVADVSQIDLTEPVDVVFSNAALPLGA